MVINEKKIGCKYDKQGIFPLFVHSHTLRISGMLTDVTNQQLSDILLQHTHARAYTLSRRFAGENKASSQGNRALTPRPRPSVASSEGR